MKNLTLLETAIAILLIVGLWVCAFLITSVKNKPSVIKHRKHYK